jgi:ribonuclease BN (tRNA processing enzyme)
MFLNYWRRRMQVTKILCNSTLLLMALLSAAQPAATQPPTQQSAIKPSNQMASRTRVVLLGTGTPVPDPDRSGPATAIVVDDSAYLVDFGPGVVRRAKAAVLSRHITALEPANLKVAFATHLHSDHTAGYSDLILTGWTAGRRTPLDVYGPAGLRSMTEHILQAYQIDIEARTSPGGDQRSNAEGWKVNAHEITPGVIYQDEKVKVTAFPTQHAVESYGFRFETSDRSVVVSGDTSPTEETIKACGGCDVLIHEARALEMFTKLPEERRSFGAKNHTTSEQLAALATKAKPGLLIVYHAWISWWPTTPGNPSTVLTSGEIHSTSDVLQKEIGLRYAGQFVIGRDLDVY